MSGTQNMAAQDDGARDAEDRQDFASVPVLLRFRRRIGRGLESAARVFRWRHRASERAWGELETEIWARALSRARRHHLSREDAEDLASEACLRLFTLLAAPEAARVRRLEGYVHRLIDNLCKEQICREKPVWSHVRGEVVETPRGRRAVSGFALWRHGALDLCGFVLRNGRPIRWTERYAEVQHNIQPLRGFLSDRGVSTSSTSHARSGQRTDVAVLRGPRAAGACR